MMRRGVQTTKRVGSNALRTVSIPAARNNRTQTQIRHMSTAKSWKVDDPYTGDVFAEVPILEEADAQRLVVKAAKTFDSWKNVPLEQRIQLVEKWIVEFGNAKEQIALDISKQMGKPLNQAKGEVDGTISRAKALIEMSRDALKSDVLSAPDGFMKKITKEPIGVVLCLCPWNYPLLTAVNTIVAAILSGNTVLLKHSDRTPLCADHFSKTFEAAGAPKGLLTSFHADHDLVARIIAHPAIQYVQFTGSVSGGNAVYQAVARQRFIDVGLELGGKDPAYVTAEADLQFAIDNVVDGGMYNAGQSCCAVERVYVHEAVYEQFLDGATKLINSYVLGDPRDARTSMGPMATSKSGSFLNQQVVQATKLGARLLTGGRETTDPTGKGRFFQPTLVADCNHDMSIMIEESFGPLLAVQKVSNDAEAIKLMNDSPYGLTASVWTANLQNAETLCSQLNAGTVYLNRCDFLDPYLPWSGRKDSGKGIGLSKYAFANFVRTKGWNWRTVIPK